MNMRLLDGKEKERKRREGREAEKYENAGVILFQRESVEY